MERIAQRELRNQVSAVLRRAELGERFTVTVGGERRAAAPERLAAALAESPVDPDWGTELYRLRETDRAAARDPWSD
jgi:antitoxin (DNA-binding transcriptional repressor) of toxin-antitoxin stability system